MLRGSYWPDATESSFTTFLIKVFLPLPGFPLDPEQCRIFAIDPSLVHRMRQKPITNLLFSVNDASLPSVNRPQP